MTGQELVEEAAKRAAAELCSHISSPTQLTACIEYQAKEIVSKFALFAELIEAARELVSACPNCKTMPVCLRHERLIPALAAVEKLGGEQ